MSYSFGMYFKQVGDRADAFDFALKVSKLHYKNAKQVIHTERYYIPSIHTICDNRITADRCWLNEIFSLRFVYWEKYGLLGLSGFDYPDDVEKMFDCHIHFQNSCDQDYSFDTWSPKIDLFQENLPKYVSMSEADLMDKIDKDLDYTEEEIKDMADYYRRSAFYTFVYDELHLNNWLWDHEDDFFLRFSFNSLDSIEKKNLAYRFVMKEVADYKKEESEDGL